MVGSLLVLLLSLEGSQGVKGSNGAWVSNEYLVNSLSKGREVALPPVKDVVLPLELNVGRYEEVSKVGPGREHLLRIAKSYEQEVLPRLISEMKGRGGRVMLYLNPFMMGLPYLERASLEEFEQAPEFAYSPTTFYRYHAPKASLGRIPYIQQKLNALPAEVDVILSFTYPRFPTLVGSVSTREEVIRVTGVDPVDLGPALQSPTAASLDKLPKATAEAELAVLAAREKLVADVARQWVESLGNRRCFLSVSAANHSTSLIERAGIGVSEADFAASTPGLRLSVTVQDGSEATMRSLPQILEQCKGVQELAVLIGDKEKTVDVATVLQNWVSQVKFSGSLRFFILEKD